MWPLNNSIHLFTMTRPIVSPLASITWLWRRLRNDCDWISNLFLSRVIQSSKKIKIPPLNGPRVNCFNKIISAISMSSLAARMFNRRHSPISPHRRSTIRMTSYGAYGVPDANPNGNWPVPYSIGPYFLAFSSEQLRQFSSFTLRRHTRNGHLTLGPLHSIWRKHFVLNRHHWSPRERHCDSSISCCCCSVSWLCQCSHPFCLRSLRIPCMNGKSRQSTKLSATNFIWPPIRKWKLIWSTRIW